MIVLTKEEQAAYAQIRRLAFPDLFKIYRLKWRKKNRGRYLEQSQRAAYKRKYGISLEERDSLLEANGGICPVCENAPAVHIDHDHNTGKVRGALCLNCNVGIGMLGDSIDLLRRAIRYLSKTR